MTDDDLLGIAADAAADLFVSRDGEVADRLELLDGGRRILGALTFAAVRDRIADALRPLAAELNDARARVAELETLALSQAERIAAQSELLSRAAEEGTDG